MSELMYIFGQMDARVRPLVFTIRHWARTNLVTRQMPGPQMSNYTLTLLVLFFLQTRTLPVLPSVLQLKDLAGKAHIYLLHSYCTALFFLFLKKNYIYCTKFQHLGKVAHGAV